MLKFLFDVSGQELWSGLNVGPNINYSPLLTVYSVACKINFGSVFPVSVE